MCYGNRTGMAYMWRMGKRENLIIAKFLALRQGWGGAGMIVPLTEMNRL